MTLLDLIRKLHSEGKPAVAYDLFICENSLMEPEEAVSVGDTVYSEDEQQNLTGSNKQSAK